MESQNHEAAMKLICRTVWVSLQSLAILAEKDNRSLDPGLSFYQPTMKESHGDILLARQRLSIMRLERK